MKTMKSYIYTRWSPSCPSQSWSDFKLMPSPSPKYARFYKGMHLCLTTSSIIMFSLSLHLIWFPEPFLKQYCANPDGLLQLEVMGALWIAMNNLFGSLAIFASGWKWNFGSATVNNTYCQISNISHTKSKTLISRLVFQLSLSNPLKPGVKLRMEM